MRKRWISLAKRGMVIFFLLITGVITAGSKNEVETKHNPRYYARRAENLEQAGNWEAAKREIDTGLELYPSDPDLRYLNGRYYYYSKNDLNKARYNLIKAIQENDDHYQAKRVLVDVEDDSKHYSSSICYINELLEFQPYDRDLWRRKIALYNKIGQHQEADEALQRLARIYPNDTIIRRDLANRNRENWAQRLQKSTLSDAATDLESWIDIDPTNLDYYLELVNIYYKLGQIERAIGTANRGLEHFKGNQTLITKAASMMAELGNYTRALSFLRAHKSTGKLYNQLLKETADDNRAHDPYESNGRLYATTKDNDALIYLVNTSVVRGYYPDAIEYLNEAYKRFGERPDLLMKQYGLEKRFGNEKKALAVLEKLFKASPRDPEIRDEYIDMILALVDHDVETEQWDEAARHLDRVLSLISPSSDKWANLISRKINILGHLNQLEAARKLYLESVGLSPANRDRFSYAFQEVAAGRIKTLVENEEYERALLEAEDLLEMAPDSEAALRTCINMSQTLGRTDLFHKYALMGYDKYPNSPYFIVKEAVALQQQGKDVEALELLRPDKYQDEYVNPQLLNAYAGMSTEYATLLLQNHMPEQAMERIDTALYYDATNKDLLYLKGIAYEQLHDYAKAWEYQMKYYNPNNAEQADWYQHMRYLKWRSYPNRISAEYNAAYFDSTNDDLTTIAHMYSIGSLTYSYFGARDTYTGKLSYKGVDGHYNEIKNYESGGFGVELMGQWDHVFNNRWSGFVNASYGTKYFNLVGANVGAAWNLPKNWTLTGRLGYRFTSPTYIVSKKNAEDIYYRRYSVFLLTPGVQKTWGERIVTAASLDLIGMQTGFYYNVGLKGKIFVNNDNVSSVGVNLGFGSFPELAFFDQTGLSTLSKTNAMVGLEGMYLVTNNLALSLSGAWNTYYYPVRLHFDEPMVDSYRNVFNINLGVHVAF